MADWALRVVVIDDHRDVALAVAYALEALGCRATVAHDAESGLAAILEARPDLVLVDIVLPKLDGWQLARAIRELPLDHQPRLVSISGYDSADDRARSHAAGFEAHIGKPIGVADLLRVATIAN
jgi:CheY-like chemotaxis protein